MGQEIAVYCKGLTKRYKDITAVDGLDLEIKQGELFSLLGENGAGKSTTIKMLSGIAKITEGSAEICGFDIEKQETHAKQFIGISPQETAVAPNLNVTDNLMLIAKLYGVKDAKERTEKLIEQMNLQSVANKSAKKLSGGTQRRLSIAMALVSNPQVVFLDEPTLGLDVVSRRELWKVINGLKGKLTVILTTHYMEEAEKLSDRVGIIHKGKLTACDTVENLIKDNGAKNLEEAFLKVCGAGVEL